MKIKILILSILAFILYNCQNEGIQNASTDYEFIDVDVSKPFCEFDSQEIKLFHEARERIDQYVSYKNGKYILDITDSRSIGLSENVFEYFKNLIVQVNVNLQDIRVYEIAPKILQIGEAEIATSIQRLKTRAENEGGGITKVIVYWYGFDVYLSHNTLITCKTGSAIATAVSAYCGQAEIALISAMCYAFSDDFITRYPNGVIISITYLPYPLPACVPYNIKGQ